jgi:hypothetical protein
MEMIIMQHIVDAVIAACILHNMCLVSGDNDLDDWSDECSNSNDQCDNLCQSNTTGDGGKAKRDLIASMLM